MSALLAEPAMEMDRMPPGHPLQDAEGVFSVEALETQQVALAALPDYDVTVLKRKTIGEVSSTCRAEYHEEIVYFSDGAVRRLTRAMPNESWFGPDGTSRHPISGTDALGTGPKGINAKVVSDLAESGYSVEWLHHQGRDAAWPTNRRKAERLARFLFGKSVGRSAHHQHALFDDLSSRGGVVYDGNVIFGAGDSRGANTGEAVDALASRYNRSVGYSDYYAECFNRCPSFQDFLRLPLAGPKEAISFGKLVISTLSEDLKQGNIDNTINMLGTFDLHPMNIIHELAWIVPLINGGTGQYGNALPLDSRGVRTHFIDDEMSQHQAWQATHADRPNMHFFVLPGSHLTLAKPEVQAMRTERFQRLLDEMRKHNFHLPDVDYNYVIFNQPNEQVGA